MMQHPPMLMRAELLLFLILLFVLDAAYVRGFDGTAHQ
jgi:hypothetical protein